MGEIAEEGLSLPKVFALVPWGHHREIISKCKNVEEALFYIKKTVSLNWSRDTLTNCIKADLYHTSGGAITNFAERLPAPQSELAQAITKDTYDFGFLTLEQGYQEESLETELESHLTRFLLEMGVGFAYLGRQRQIVVAGKVRRLDMLFFHIPLNCYVVVELKTVPFQPEFAGKLNFYITAADELLRGEGDNPSVGLVICKTAKRTVVEWSLQDIQKPLGVATYQLQEVVDRTVAELEQRKKQKEDEV